MASASFDDKIEEKKPTVQVGDPFTEKLLLEACLELMKDDSIISIQDMGAAGLTSSSVEMASKGNLGIEINLDKVPCREEKMTPYEIMLSESQERMLLILKSGKEESAKKIFNKWSLDFSIIGVFVFIFIPSAAGIAQDAIGFGDFSNSTKHILQFPAIDNFS